MDYKETEKKLNEIKRKDEAIFRMAISHLMDVGIRHLTDSLVEQTCKEIMTEDDSHSFMTNEYKCELLRTALQLAKVDHIHLLVYISKHIEYSV